MLRPFPSLTAMPPSSSRLLHPKRMQNPNSNSKFTFSFFPTSSCKHSPSATLDLLILLLVLFSCAFLVASSLAHIARALSPFLSPLFSAAIAAPFPYLAAPFLLLLAGAAAHLLLRGWKRRLCRNPRCRGMKKALEFDVQLQTEESLRGIDDAAGAAMWKEIEELPWKGGQKGNNPDYECLRAELRRMAPPNGRAVLLFRARCGCPVAKLEAWGPKRGRRHKKGTQNLALEGGDR
ncbi:uncharacterized protein At5g19025-like [Typha latifolia]|uniref:uncharacterized protein At5g19025-like n=1 Tax=Typha latifolia TaxID=4733 RepID=UPI003C2DBF56